MLIVSKHAVDRARERISLLKNWSYDKTEEWLMEKVPVAKKIRLGSELYFGLEDCYNEKECRPVVYRMDDFGIYITEFIEDFNIYLRSVQELRFKRGLKVKLAESLGDKSLQTLMRSRNVLEESQRVNKEIPNLIA